LDDSKRTITRSRSRGDRQAIGPAVSGSADGAERPRAGVPARTGALSAPELIADVAVTSTFTVSTVGGRPRVVLSLA